MIPLASHLSILESAGLFAVARTEPELEYLFRHTLIQDVAYASLLKSERTELHRITGEVLEGSYPDRLAELAPRLADHFLQAGELPKAYQYLLHAAESASRRYANAEAIEYYSRALEIAGDPVERRRIFQARGVLREASGAFEQSQADLEMALMMAHQARDLLSEWESLINLGFLWASRDYHQTGRYYRRALKVARQLKDDRALAHSLNRLGNYAINVDHPDQSLQHHQEALAIFTRLNDDLGRAETLDMLGMASAMGGDMFRSRDYLYQAIEIFEKMGDRRSVTSAISTLAVTVNSHMTGSMVTQGLTADDGVLLAERALQEAGSIGWKSGEIFSLAVMTTCLAARGDYQRGLESAARGLQIAEEIQHYQWEISIRMGLGSIYLDLLLFDQAREIFEPALTLARKTNSVHWILMMAGSIGMACLGSGDAAGAAAFLDEILTDSLPARTLGQRIMWSTRAEAALALGDVRRALEIVDRLLRDTPNRTAENMPVRLGRLWAEALAAEAREAATQTERSDRWQAAEGLLDAILQVSIRDHYRACRWQIYRARARLFRDQGRIQDSLREQMALRDDLLELSYRISVPGLRQGLLAQVQQIDTQGVG